MKLVYFIVYAARINIDNSGEIQRNYGFVISSDSNVRFDLVNERLWLEFLLNNVTERSWLETVRVFITGVWDW